MRTTIFTVLSALIALGAGWRPVLAEDAATFTGGSVTVTITVREVDAAAGQAVLEARFVPDPTEKHPLHLYDKDLPRGGVGEPTRITVAEGVAAGALSADHEPRLLDATAAPEDQVKVYPPGPVTLRLSIHLPAGAVGGTTQLPVTFSFMACSDQFCKQPVLNQRVMVAVPIVARAAVTPTTPTRPVPVPAIDAAALTLAVREAVRDTVRTELAAAREGLAWRHPASVAEAEALIDDARARGRAVLLDFTGPSCVNCQKMEKTVFRVPNVRAALAQLDAVSINTDPPFQALANWQSARFHSQNRPLYVRLATDGSETRWSEVFSPDDRATLDRFLTFVNGGAGSDAGTGQGWWQFVALALLGGLVTLLMPCTYPMIPFTINVFAKQAASGRRLLPLAAFYAFGIIACFVGLGVIITGVLGASLATVAGHPLTNLLIAALFIVLGLSLLGAFLLRLPGGLENRIGGARGGYLGALIMGLTFAVTAFSCAAPFAGSVLAQAVATGSWLRAVVGMAIYASAIAVPFFVLAMTPGALKKLPKAGAWMNEFKLVGGVVELAAALKFLVIADHAWNWGVVGRTFVLVAWSTAALLLALYLLGIWRAKDDAPVSAVGVGRLLIAGVFLALGIWLAAGLTGLNLGVIESFFPGDTAPI